MMAAFLKITSYLVDQGKSCLKRNLNLRKKVLDFGLDGPVIKVIQKPAEFLLAFGLAADVFREAKDKCWTVSSQNLHEMQPIHSPIYWSPNPLTPSEADSGLSLTATKAGLRRLASFEGK
ncbi:hypothetical protein AVEN_101076-1 [Araneus ventricosus]|uniref:Uncharacterized protein n=1 Tax=Araneus ventricosus TaxID=182803 RepID=A0A4Y2SB56_ARAVE|nr:hypothetical protein AVEN_101076-1 [Araneus ventricosus]